MTPTAEPARTVIRTVREARFGSTLYCVRCGSDAVIRWGGFKGRQRYRCRKCQRTFSDLTGTAFAYTKLIDRWPRYLDHVRRSHTLRRAARDLDVQVSTTFRWRHAILSAMRVVDPVTLSGAIELKEISFAVSNKGARGLAAPRRRGLRNRGWPWYRIAHDRVLLTRARNGTVFSATVGGEVVVVDAVRRLLLPRLSGRCTLYACMPRAGTYSLLRAAGHGWNLVRFPDGTTDRDPRHILNVNAYSRRLMVWLERFGGVASRYRDNYLVWHRVVDAADRFQWIEAVIVASLRCSGR